MLAGSVSVLLVSQGRHQVLTGWALTRRHWEESTSQLIRVGHLSSPKGQQWWVMSLSSFEYL